MDKDMKNEYKSEMFEFVDEKKEYVYDKFDIKPIGYFKDAMIRFSKNKASVIAFVIIILIVMFALLVPIVTKEKKANLMDTYYSKKGPRILSIKESIGIFDGSNKIEMNERGLILELSKGLGAEFSEENDEISLEKGIDSYYQPVIKYKKSGDKQWIDNALYEVDVDSYLSVGFIYDEIEQTEYNNILKWEKETGKKILYPLIANNEYCANKSDANYWYKTIGKAIPIIIKDGKETIQKFSTNMVLEENYMRDSEGNFVYYTNVGGGTLETAQYRVRILYYNYYEYLNGFEPEYIIGTDSQGYDLAYRLSTGIGLSLVLAILVSLINFIVGAVIGATEGYYGKGVDLVLERIKDILSGVPFIIVATLFQLHLSKKLGAFPSLVFAFILTGWIGTSSRVRTQFYRFKNQEYVMAARTLGASDKRIIWKHIFPNTLGTIITSSVLIIPSVIFSESMLSYLGIVNLGGSGMIEKNEKDGRALCFLVK